MRSVLYAHDGPLITSDYKTFYGIHINDNIKRRYLALGHSVTFLMRVRKKTTVEVQNLAPMSNDDFAVIEVPDFKSATGYLTKRHEAKRIVKQAVMDHDIVVARLPSATGGMAVKYAIQNRKPLLVEYVACTFDAYWNYNWKGKLIAYWKMWEQRQLMSTVSHTIYVTRNFLQNRYPTPGKNIACSDVELKEVDATVLSGRLEKIRTWDGARPLILATMAALDVPYKGQANVITALAHLKKEGIVFRYKIVGKGNDTVLKEQITRLNLEREVEIVGPLPHEKVFECLRDVDIYIQPSKQEGLPRAVVEAMSMACPVLGSRLAGIPELIDDEMMFTPGAVHEICGRLKGLNKTLMEKHAIRNFNAAKSYQKHLLEQKRMDFFRMFLADHQIT